ncbi:MAG TPA: hypothetical protein GXX22_09260 [Clostridiales bacterium]|nr:hypothetical protein [Clostridiales bacterium]
MDRLSARPPHKIGDCVLYRNCGICKICDIAPLEFGDGNTEYYVLRSVFDESSVAYVPVDSELAQQMRPLLTKSEVLEVIDNAPYAGTSWIEDSKLRAHAFSKLIDSGNRADILWIILTLTEYRAELASKRRKLYSSDEKLLATALHMIKEEFAFVLGIDREEVIPYIRNRLGRDLVELPPV